MMETIIRPYQLTDIEACRALWAELPRHIETSMKIRRLAGRTLAPGSTGTSPIHSLSRFGWPRQGARSSA